MNYPVSVKYKGNGSNFVWPMPFPFGDMSDFGVRLKDSNGIERLLEPVRDYLVENTSLICLVPLGCEIILWLKTPPAEAEAANQARVMAASSPGQTAMTSANSRAASEPGPVFADGIDASLTSDAEMATAEAEKILANANSRATEIISEAESSARNLSRAAASEIETLLDRTRRYCEQLREKTWREAETAVKVGRQLSLYRNMPGISAVDSIKDLKRPSAGLFVVVPGITHPPTPFMGIWPVKCVGDMTFDGVFFIGPEYPEKITLPPADAVPPPWIPEASGNSRDWIPCDHIHFDKCDCSGK